jgi:N-acetylneuraminate synthase
MYVIAELGLHHRGNTDEAMRLIKAAADAGAHAVKLQMLNKHDLEKRSKGSWSKLKHCHIPSSEMGLLHQYAHALKLRFGVTVYGPDGYGQTMYSTANWVDFIKVSGKESRDNADLCELIQSTSRKPVYCSIYTGEREPFDAAQMDWNLLHCTKDYPTKWGNLNLELAGTWGGWSCHANPIDAFTAATLAYAAGARTFEFHMRMETTPVSSFDYEVSLTPTRIRGIIAALDYTRIALGEQYQ